MMLRADQRTAALRTLFAVRHALFFISLLLCTVSARADSIDELRALVEASDAQAWEMAQRMADANGGDPDFDFWYALAAKAAGRMHEAVFALERVVAQQPGNPRAKLELGDVYYQFGNTREARVLFDEVLATTPPDAVQQRIRTYLGAIEAKDKQQRVNIDGFVTVAGGYDSNINGGTSAVTHDIPGIAVPMTLAPASLETDAYFADWRAGIDLVQPTSQRDARFFSASVQARDNEDLFSGGNFDYTQAVLRGGWMKKRGTAFWRIPLSAQSLRLEDDDTRYLLSVVAVSFKKLSVNTTVSWFGQLAENHFPSQESRNTRQLLLGGAWHWNSTHSPLRLIVAGNLGYEPAKDSQYDENGRTFAALRLSLRYPLSAQHSLYGAMGAQQSNYMAEHNLIGSKRQDLLADMSAGWQWQVNRAWTVNADLTYAENMSADTELFDYDRSTASLGATWRF